MTLEETLCKAARTGLHGILVIDDACAGFKDTPLWYEHVDNEDAIERFLRENKLAADPKSWRVVWDTSHEDVCSDTPDYRNLRLVMGTSPDIILVNSHPDLLSIASFTRTSMTVKRLSEQYPESEIIYYAPQFRD
ncbi:hypothetical protein KY363_08245, partial [Candidatus Woesearchaeota archaeon]|nr:hypothetical protein [Candidatus Woesearchaeota archaeon]